MHYVRIWDSIYDGSLVESFEGMTTFLHILILANADGIVDMTPEAIARRTGTPLDVVRKGLEVLEAEDPRSRNPALGGRRIVRLEGHRDWGWRIVNFYEYRDLTEEARKRGSRERSARWRERRKATMDPEHGLTSGNGDAGQSPVLSPGQGPTPGNGDVTVTSRERSRTPSSKYQVTGKDTPSNSPAPLQEPLPLSPEDHRVVILLPARAAPNCADLRNVPILEGDVRRLEAEYRDVDVRAELVAIRRWCLKQAETPRRGKLWARVMPGVHNWLANAARDVREGTRAPREMTSEERRAAERALAERRARELEELRARDTAEADPEALERFQRELAGRKAGGGT